MTIPTLMMQRAHNGVMADDCPTLGDKPRRRRFTAEFYAANPCRFGNRRPSPPKRPTAAWINKPTIENDAQKKS
jgi:hypothetical protein